MDASDIFYFSIQEAGDNEVVSEAGGGGGSVVIEETGRGAYPSRRWVGGVAQGP